MKRILSLILVSIMLLTMLISCGNEVDTDTDSQIVDTSTDTGTDTSTDTDTKINPGEILDLINPDKEVNKEKGYLFERPYRSFTMEWQDIAREWGWDDLSAFEKIYKTSSWRNKILFKEKNYRKRYAR